MENNGIAYQFSYHIIPFAFQREFEEVKNELDSRVNDCDKKCWQREDFGGGQRFFEHAKRLIDGRHNFNATIGVRYNLTDAARPEMGLPGNSKDKLVLKIRKDNGIVEYKYSILKVHLYVFETQVGFLAFDIGYNIDSTTLDDVIESNYYIKNILQNKGSVFFRKKVGRDETNDFDISIEDLIRKSTEGLEVTTFFENERGLPKQAIVYNAVCLKDNQADKLCLESSLFRMRRLFKGSYKPSSLEMKLHENEEVLHLFDNSYWGAALEGMANLSHLTEDADTNKFFTSTYSGMIETSYLYLYIITLHQRYALLNYSIIASEIKKVSCMARENLKIIDEIRSVKLDIAYFYLRCNFKNLSNITHQDRLYNLLRNVLKIDGLSEEINNELNGLSAILEDQVEKIRKLEEKEKIEKESEKSRKESSRFNFLTIAISTIAALFWLPSIVISFWDIINRIHKGEVPLYNSDKFFITILAPLLFIILPLLIIGVIAVRLRNSKDID